MVLDYSKWDAIELSDDSDIEVHPNVDKRSFIRAKQNQIHQERFQRKHQIETLKYERIINDGLLTRIDALLNSLNAHASSAESPDELVFQSLIESAGDPADDQPPPRPEGVHSQVEEQPTYSKMMATLVDQVKKQVDETNPENRLKGYIDEIGTHRDKVLGLQQELLKKLAELEKQAGTKITSDSIRTGFNSSAVAKSTDKSTSSSSKTTSQSVELLNPPKRDSSGQSEQSDSGADADIEDGAMSGTDGNIVASELGKGFGRIKAKDFQASLQYISKNPSVLAEKETDGLLMEAFDHQLAGKEDLARQSVHQALLLQYCRTLGKDGVTLFFKRITTPGHQAQQVFFDDVNNTYARLRDRAKEMSKEASNEEGVEQIQLHAVNPGQKIVINIPSSGNPDEAESRQIFESFPPGLQRALESGELDEVNKVLGKMSVEEAEEVVGQLSEGGMLSMEEGIIDGTTEEGQQQMRDIEEMGRMPARQEAAGRYEPGEPMIEEVD